MPLRGRQQQVALLDAIALLVDQSLSSVEPAVGPCRLAPREQSEAEPESRATRGEIGTGLQVCVIQALLGSEHLIIARGQAG